MTPPALSGTPWAEHYETLRRLVLAGREPLGAQPLGVGLVCRRGLAGWIEAWRRAAQPPGVAVPPPLPVSASPGWHHELTVLLAEMTARHLSSAFS